MQTTARTYPHAVQKLQEFRRQEADIALYDAKAAGRNKVHLFGDEGHSRAA